MMITSFSDALSYVYSHIPQTSGTSFPGHQGLERMKLLMKNLGDPQDTYPVIHIAGTSGKGSTATLISHALASQDKRVGLTVSPHLLDIRERIQINNRLISQDKFVTYLNEMIPMIEKTSSQGLGAVTYFEILVALAYYGFWKENVDYAVIETGLGGLLDGTNVVNRADKICIITKIGFDHMQVLGNTLPEIARQKAGIIHPHNTVITIEQDREVMDVLLNTAKTTNAPFSIISSQDFAIKSVTPTHTVFEDTKLFQTTVTLGLVGQHQAENAMLAIAALHTLSNRDVWSVNIDSLSKVWQNLRLPARVDVRTYRGKELIIDGAHNAQKMGAFLKTLTTIYPQEKFTFLVAFKHGKDIKDMIADIEPFAKEIVVTDFRVEGQDMLNISEPASTVASYVTKVLVTEVSGAQKAFNTALEKDQRIIITGSLYFASEIYTFIQ